LNIDNARELKERLARDLVRHFAMSERGLPTRGVTALSARPVGDLVDSPNRSIAFGVAVQNEKSFGLAIRVQRRELESSAIVEQMRTRARDEVDVRYIGRVLKAAVPWHQKSSHPLRLGSSVGHNKITAGTLGAFVKWRDATRARRQPVLLLSNNHVLANENHAKSGDVIVQPGPMDSINADGSNPRSIARLAEWVDLDPSGPNVIDCAVAAMNKDVAFDARTLRGMKSPRRLRGLGSPLELDDRVCKVGRTTGVTRGKVTAIELDNVVVRFDVGNCRFDNQLEIEGDDHRPFSDGGDSGSLIVDRDGFARGLLFAGSDQGGSNGKGFTFANPLDLVLNTLEIDLIA
jgi:hypothetical protein